MKTNLVKLSAVAVALAGGIHSASASVYDVYYKISNPGNTSGNAYDGTSGHQDLDTFDVKFNGTTYDNVLAGGIQITKTSETAGGPTMPANYLTVCTDFLGSLYLGSTYKYTAPAASFTTVDGHSNGQTGGGIAPAWNNNANGYAIQNASQIFYQHGDVGSGGINTGSGTKLSVTQMAALQLAIWIALYDTTSTGTIGNYLNNNLSTVGSDYFVLDSDGSTLDNAILGYVATDLSGLTGHYFNTGYLLQPDSLTSSQGNPNGHVPQELLMGSSNSGGGSGNGSVPEPTTVLAAALLLIPLGASTIRILRKSHAK
jgi:hypothetical protein